MSSLALALAHAAATWGSLPAWLTAAAVAALAYVLVRGGAGQAVEGLQATNRELQRQITELKGKVDDLTAENAELRGRTDVALAIAPAVVAVKEHELQAARRSERVLTVLDLIAKRLGKDGDDDLEARLSHD